MRISVNRLFTLSLIFCSFLLLGTSCKSKQKLTDAELERMQKREMKNDKALTEAGVDNSTKTDILKTLQDLDQELIDFLNTDPENDAQIAMMKTMREKRLAALKDKLSNDQIKAYMRSLSKQSKATAKKEMKFTQEKKKG